ncbi:MAG: hypothetical protein QXL94_06680 [Candidatus Parvarchaeum sp.]
MGFRNSLSRKAIAERKEVYTLLVKAALAKKFKASWAGEGNMIVGFIIAIIVGMGIALYIGGVLVSALPSNGIAANAVNSILTGIQTNVVPIISGIIAIAFIVVLYILVDKAGLLGGKSKRRGG